MLKKEWICVASTGVTQASSFRCMHCVQQYSTPNLNRLGWHPDSLLCESFSFLNAETGRLWFEDFNFFWMYRFEKQWQHKGTHKKTMIFFFQAGTEGVLHHFN